MKRDRFDSTVDISDDTKPVRVQRVEVITGVERRRTWPVAKKLAIVAESEVEGAVVCEVARRHGIKPQQLFCWRSKLVKRRAPAPMKPAAFAPVVVEASSPSALPAPEHLAPAPVIEIALGCALVRIRGSVEQKTLTTVLKLLKGIA
jgi:transposase